MNTTTTSKRAPVAFAELARFRINAAWDYAADTRGYSNGVAVDWIHPHWSLRASAMQMPLKANGNVFDSDLARAHGFNAELEEHVVATGTVVRFLAYENEARMGLYSEALAVAGAAAPIIALDDKPGRREDRAGIAAVVDGVVNSHRQYLAAGGDGFLLGDGGQCALERAILVSERIPASPLSRATP